MTSPISINEYCSLTDTRPNEVLESLRLVVEAELKTNIYIKKDENFHYKFLRENKDGSLSLVGNKRFYKIKRKFELEMENLIFKSRKHISLNEIVEVCVTSTTYNCIFTKDKYENIITINKSDLGSDTKSYTPNQNLLVKIIKIRNERIYATRLDKEIITNLINNFNNIPFDIYILKRKNLFPLIYLYVKKPYFSKETIELIKNLDFKFIVKKWRKK